MQWRVVSEGILIFTSLIPLSKQALQVIFMTVQELLVPWVLVISHKMLLENIWSEAVFIISYFYWANMTLESNSPAS